MAPQAQVWLMKVATALPTTSSATRSSPFRRMLGVDHRRRRGAGVGSQQRADLLRCERPIVLPRDLGGGQLADPLDPNAVLPGAAGDHRLLVDRVEQIEGLAAAVGH